MILKLETHFWCDLLYLNIKKTVLSLESRFKRNLYILIYVNLKYFFKFLLHQAIIQFVQIIEYES